MRNLAGKPEFWEQIDRDAAARAKAHDADYIRTILDDFCTVTNRLMPSHEDYAQAQTWEYAGIPLTVVQRGIRDKLDRAQGKRYIRSMPLSWCDDDVVEGFNNWRRAVGPWGQR